MSESKDHLSTQQTAIGSYIAQATEGSKATINVYAHVLSQQVEQATIEAALERLAQMPLDHPPDTNVAMPDSRLPLLERNPFFVGREDDLRMIASLLKTDEHAAVVVTGMGGQGKSQLTNELVHRYGQYFAGGVFWLSFADRVGIPSEIAACTTVLQRELRPDINMLSMEAQVYHVLAAWQNAKPRLLIFDNCEEEDLLAQWRPPIGGCRLLVTSRRATWSKDVHIKLHPLGDLHREESIDLLGKYRPDISTDERNAIAEEVGDLPLALNLAGNYLEEYQESRLGTAEAYLAALRWTTPLLHPSLHSDGTNYPTRHIRDVARTFALSYERLNVTDTIDAIAIALEARMAHFALGVSVPRDLLRATMGPEEDDQLEEAVVQGLKRLTTLGLLEKQPESMYRLHRLLAEFVCLQPTVTAQNQEAKTEVEQAMLATAYTLNHAGYPVPLLALQPHLRKITNAALPREDEMAADLCHELFYHLQDIGMYVEAIIYAQKALAIRQQVLSDEHPRTVQSYNNLAALYQMQGKYEQAEPLYQKALAIRQQVRDDEHPITAQSYNNLAALYHMQGKYEQAELLFQKALAICQQVLGETHPHTADTYNNLAELYRDQGKYEQAEQLYRKASVIYQQVLGDEHPRIAQSYNNLALLYHCQGKYGQAEPLYQKALAIRQQILGEMHPHTADSYNNLAELYRNQSKYEQAEPLYQKALAICQQVLSDEHPDTAQSYSNLAVLYSAQGKYKQAEQLYQKALAIYQRMLGDEHSATLRVKRNYDMLLDQMRLKTQ